MCGVVNWLCLCFGCCVVEGVFVVIAFVFGFGGVLFVFLLVVYLLTVFVDCLVWCIWVCGC